MAEELTIRHRYSNHYTEDEIEVAKILLSLRKVIPGQDFLSRLPFFWGSKRKRSAISNDNDDNNNGNDNQSPALRLGPKDKADEPVTAKAEASSPATPLSFSPSESEEKRPRPLKRKHHLKRKREEWLEIIKGLTNDRELLKREKENVNCYFDKLKAFNSELKARKEELITGIKRETPNLKIGQRLNHVMEMGQAKKVSSSIAAGSSQEIHHRPSIRDRTAQLVGDMMSKNIQYPETHVVPLSVSNNGFNNNNVVSPIGLPDLNVSTAEESSYGTGIFQPLDLTMTNKDLSRQMATEARKRRREINRVKNSIAYNKLRYHYV